MISAMKNPERNLPPGFRFHPTDEELVLHYLEKKVSSSQVPVPIIADVDIYKFDPWDLPAKAVFGEKEWYFFSPRDRKYPNGARPNRAAASGYWKATGTDKIISAKIGGRLHENIGVKKALVFYQGRPPKGIKTNWIMHEYRLSETLVSNKHIPNDTVAVTGFRSKKSSMRLDDWVLCRIYNKTYGSASSADANRQSSDQEHETEQVITQENLFQNLGCNKQEVFSNSFLKPQKSCSFSNLLDAADFSMLNSFLSDNPYDQSGIFEFPSTISNSSSSPKTVFDNLGNFSDAFLEQKLPQLSSLSSPERSGRENVKRQREDFDDLTVNPSKKIFSYDQETPQKLNFSPHFQFYE